MKNDVYVITASGFEDTFYHVFYNEKYFNAYLDIYDYFYDDEIDKIKDLVKKLQKSDGLFSHVTDFLIDDEWFDMDDLFPKEEMKVVNSISMLNKLIEGKNVAIEAEIEIC